MLYIELESDGGQGLKRTDTATVAAGAYNTLAIRVTLRTREAWENMGAYARFEFQSAYYDVPLEADYTAVVPGEVCKYPAFLVSLWGEDQTGARITTERVAVEVERSLDYDGAEPIPATSSLVQRFNELVEECIDVSKGLTFAKTYATVAAMEADTSGDVEAGEFVLIQSGTDSEPEDGQIYMRNGAGWLFVGNVGQDGEPGAAATVAVDPDTVTGEPETPASVENIGTAQNVILKFTIPQGLPGESDVTYPIAVDKGGTGATTADGARSNLDITPANIGAAAATHSHAAGDIASGTLPIERGGTGAATAAAARTNLGVAAATHNHAASAITSGTLAVARGGTGAATAADALTNLGAAESGHTHTDIVRVEPLELAIPSTSKNGGNSSVNVDAPTVDGYAPVGVLGYTLFTGTRQNWLNVWKCYFDSSDNKIYVSVCNMNTSDAASGTIRVYILYQRA